MVYIISTRVLQSLSHQLLIVVGFHCTYNGNVAVSSSGVSPLVVVVENIMAMFRILWGDDKMNHSCCRFSQGLSPVMCCVLASQMACLSGSTGTRTGSRITLLLVNPQSDNFSPTTVQV
jgi:hypothetical protein